MSSHTLTAQSTQTLSLLLELERLKTLPSFSTSKQTHLTRITDNLNSLRTGILELEAKEGKTESVRLLRGQYERMRDMLGGQAEVPSLDPPAPPKSVTPPPPPPPAKNFAPYHDDPEDDNADEDHGIMLHTQRQMMDEQDQRLDALSHSITRQHHISLQINDELDTHVGLLDDLDHDLDRTGDRLSSARRKLEVVAKGAKANASTVTIGVLILVLLILIVKFKT